MTKSKTLGTKSTCDTGTVTPKRSASPHSPLAQVPSPAALALLAAILLDTVTEILEALVSGRLGGVPGGESRCRLLAIIREAAAGREESPVVWALGDGRPRD